MTPGRVAALLVLAICVVLGVEAAPCAQELDLPGVEGPVLFQVEPIRRCPGFGRGVYLLARRFRIYNYRGEAHGESHAEVVQSDAGVQYGLTRAFRARIVQSTTSTQAPSSSHEGRYILALSTSNTFCARSYSTIRDGKHGVRIRYTDCDTGAECQLPFVPSKPFRIDEFTAERDNVLAELRRAQQADPKRRQRP